MCPDWYVADTILIKMRKSPHSSAIPVGKVTTFKPCLDSSSPKPLDSDVPLGPSPRCRPEEGGRNLRNNTANDNSESVDTVFTALDPEKEANVSVSSSAYTTDAINHNTFNEPVMADVSRHVDTLDAYERNSLAAQETRSDLPSNGVDSVTPDEPDDHRDVDTGNSVESVARGRLSPVSIPSKPLGQEAPNDQS